MRSRRGRRIAGVAAATVAAGALLVPFLVCLAAAGEGITSGEAAAFLKPLAGSVVLGLVVASIGTLIAGGATLVALAVPRPVRRLIDVTMVAPLLIPPVAAAVVLVRLGGNASALHALLPAFDIYGLAGLVIANLTANVPLAYVVLRLAARSIDHRLVESLAVSGIRPDVIIWRIIAPKLAPAVALAATLLFVGAVIDPSIPAVLRGRYPTLASAALSEVVAWGSYSSAALAALMLTAVIAIACIPALVQGLSVEALIGSVGVRSGAPISIWGGTLRVASVITVIAAATVIATLAGFAVSVALEFDASRGAALVGASVIASTLGHAVAALAVSFSFAALTVWATGALSSTARARVDRVHVALAFIPATAIGVGTFLTFRAAAAPAIADGSVSTPAFATEAVGTLLVIAMLVVVCYPLVYLGLRLGRAQLPREAVDAALVAGAEPGRVSALVLSRTRTLAFAFAAAVAARAIVTVVPVVYVASPASPFVTAVILDRVDAAALGEALGLSAATALTTSVLMLIVWSSVQARSITLLRLGR